MIAYTIIRYHDDLMTPFERTVQCAFQARWKAEAYRNPNVERRMREKWGNLGDPQIDVILERGYEAFRRDVADLAVARPISCGLDLGQAIDACRTRRI